MGADPWVQVQSVGAGPAGEMLHGCQRVAALQGGADGGDHSLQSGGSGSLAERGQGLPGQSAARRPCLTAAAMTQSVSGGIDFSWPVTALTSAPS